MFHTYVAKVKSGTDNLSFSWFSWNTETKGNVELCRFWKQTSREKKRLQKVECFWVFLKTTCFRGPLWAWNIKLNLSMSNCFLPQDSEDVYTYIDLRFCPNSSGTLEDQILLEVCMLNSLMLKVRCWPICSHKLRFPVLEKRWSLGFCLSSERWTNGFCFKIKVGNGTWSMGGKVFFLSSWDETAEYSWNFSFAKTSSTTYNSRDQTWYFLQMHKQAEDRAATLSVVKRVATLLFSFRKYLRYASKVHLVSWCICIAFAACRLLQ